MVEALPASSLEVIETEFVFQFAVALFHPPACFRGGHQLFERGFPRQMRQLVARRGRFAGGPLQQRDFLNPLGLWSLLPAVGGPQA